MRFQDLFARVMLLLLSATVSLAGVEILVRVLDLFPSQIEMTLAPVELAVDDDRPVAQFMLHPYLGWSHRPGPAPEGVSWNIFGLRSPIDDYRDLEESDFVVGVLGASVARGVAAIGGKALIDRLVQERPELEGRIRIVTLASGGYKQPQQLFLLSQMQLLGVPFDAVVNVDGFNEVALGGTDAKAGFHPMLPFRSYWTMTYDFARGVPTARQIELTAQVLAANRRIVELHGFLDRRSLLARSRLVRAIVGFSMQKSARKATESEEEMGGLEQVDHAASVLEFSDPCLESDEGCWELIAQVWARASKQAAAIAATDDALYLHILQPNQYVEGTKKLTDRELEIAWNPRHQWSRSARLGYPRLVDAGARLRESGIDFHDLTAIFDDEQGEIYRDSCCHYRVRGYELIGETIGGLIADALARKQASEVAGS